METDSIGTLQRPFPGIPDRNWTAGVVNESFVPLALEILNEQLVCDRLQLTQQANSQAAYDASDDDGIRDQIKDRCSNSSRVQFSTIRNFGQEGFDSVIAVTYRPDYSIRLATTGRVFRQPVCPRTVPELGANFPCLPNSGSLSDSTKIVYENEVPSRNRPHIEIE